MNNPFAKLLPARFRGSETVIPVVRLVGTIATTGTPWSPTLSLSACASQLDKAFSFKQTPAVAIIVNSPGGSPVQSRLIYKRIRDLAVEKKKKVHVFVEDVAASGGYMIACAGDDITADPSSIVGSIGVISAGFGFTGLIEKIGVERRVYTAGKNKSVLDPFQPEKKKDIDHLKSLQIDIHKTFVDLVKERRGDRLAENDDLFSGMFWAGERGRQLGLVDELGDVSASLKARYGEKTKLKLIEVKKGLFGRRPPSISTPFSGDRIDLVAGAAASGLLGALEDRAHWSRYGL